MKQLPPAPIARAAWVYIALVAASLLAPILLFAIVAWEDRASILREAELDVTHTTDIFYEHALKVFETHELIAQVIDSRIRSMTWDEISASRPVHEYLAALAAQYPQVDSLSLADPSGTLRNSSRTFPTRPVNLSDRDYFDVLRYNDVGTFVSHVVKNPVFTEANFDVVRRRSSSNNQFDGVIIVSAYPNYFTEFWRTASPPLDMMTALIRGDDRTILARLPKTSSDELLPRSAIPAAIEHGEHGSLRAVSAMDGVERLIALRRIAPYDVFVVHGIGVNAVLAEWSRDLLLYGGFFGVAGVALSLTSFLALKRLRREHLATEQWRTAAGRLVEEAERRVAVEDQLHQAEKMEALGQLTGGIAHDFNNLLTSILGNLDPLLGRVGNEKDEAKLRNAIAAAERGEKAIQSLLIFARREPLKAEALDLNVVLQQIESLLHQALGSRADLVFAIPADTWLIEADANQLELAALNLAVNAHDAMPNGGTLRIAAANTHFDDKTGGLVGDFVAVSVSDNGIGMPPDVISRVFEPFFTTKEAGKGTGLGLSQVHGFVTQCGGIATVDSAVGRGTTVTMYLRKASSPHVRDKVSPELTDDATGRGVEKNSVILVVEDEKDIRQMVVEALREHGHTVIEASSGDEALPIVREHPEIDLIFTDMRLPGQIDGTALAREARRSLRDVRLLFTTGSAGKVAHEEGDVEESRILRKPYRPSQVVQAVINALAA